MKCVLLGAGGHGRVLIEAFQPKTFDGILDARPGLGSVAGVPVLGDDEMLPRLAGLGFTHFVIGLGSTADCAARARLYESAVQAGLSAAEVIHSSAWISPSASLGAGCQVLARAVVHVSAKLGENVLVNTGAIIEHDCQVAAHCHIATGAILCGGVTIGEAAHIGAGAVIRQGIRIGARSLVAAGAVVVKEVPDGGRVAGVPARALP